MRAAAIAVTAWAVLAGAVGPAAAQDTVARTLDQPECPLTLETQDLVHDDRGSTLKVRVLNDGAAAVTRYAINAWVLMPDGTVRGAQKFDQRQAVAPDAAREITLTIRTIRVAPTDTLVVAVVETQGEAWKGDVKALEAEARALVTR
ncbi:MAG: hypothetical protein AB7U83_19500 [Vicinamibacterales bacterium]